MRFAKFLLFFLLALPVFADKPKIKTFDEAWQKTKDMLYDKKMNGRDWDALKAQYRPLAKKAKTQDELIAITNKMLGELNLSHLVLMSQEAFEEHLKPEMGGEKRFQVGFEAVEIDGKLFVRNLLEGGPAEKAGIRRGDRLVKIAGESAKKSELLRESGSDPGLPWPPLFFVHAPDGEAMTLTIASEKGKSRDVEVTPEKLTMIDATENSVRVIKHNGMKFGYVHTWHFLDAKIYGTVSSAMTKKFSQCDGLLLDIRGRGGSPVVMNAILGLFRTGAWDKPVVLLVDDRSRSAKEIFAWLWMDEDLGPLVGRTTEGAVLGSNFVPLSDGSVILIPVQNAQFYTKGVKLEGNGVTPHHVVEHPLPYSQGYDEILEFSKDRLAIEVRRKRAKAAIAILLGLAA